MKNTYVVDDTQFLDYLISDSDDVNWLADQVITGFLDNIKAGKSSNYTISLDKYLQESDTIPNSILCDPKDWLNEDGIEKHGFANSTNFDDDGGEINVEHDLFDFDIYEEDENEKLVFLDRRYDFPNPQQAINSYKSDNNVSGDATLEADCTDEDYQYRSSKSNVILKSEMDKMFPHSGFFRNFDKLSISDSMHSTNNTDIINKALSAYSDYMPFEQTANASTYPEFVNSVDATSVKDHSKFDLQFFSSDASDQVSVEGSPLQLKIVADAVLQFADQHDYLLKNAADGFNMNYNRVYGLRDGSTDFADEHKELLGIQVDTNKTINLIKSEDCTTPLYELFAESQYNIHNVKKLFDKASELSSTDEQLQVVAIDLMGDIEAVMESDANFSVDQIKDEFKKIWKIEDNNNTIENIAKNN